MRSKVTAAFTTCSVHKRILGFHSPRILLVFPSSTYVYPSVSRFSLLISHLVPKIICTPSSSYTVTPIAHTLLPSLTCSASLLLVSFTILYVHYFQVLLVTPHHTHAHSFPSLYLRPHLHLPRSTHPWAITVPFIHTHRSNPSLGWNHACITRRSKW
jgi:hypothetical protein